MTEYSDKEKELIEYYKSLPKFSLNIFEMERLLKKPLEYAVDLEYCINNYIFIFGYNLCEIGKGLHENQYLMDEIELSKKHKTQYFSNFEQRPFLDDYFLLRGMPVREAKGKIWKRILLRYFH
ncbi:TPA: hypothetical protein HA235_01875 [Candidatus Woesearchaeota archaeon]|nr:hypothetical protein [Candidatus Woesearchaeota archaeon]HIH31433.1 hypothetical protein [Candidatus Woesearchaeota archaeon]HIH55306.1 hypothetical protein [Candidatus Woesearchaeota archaeon]HIJ01283.1 hypothetical protein [Candidatus Woesearchaeota archaeon]HIJ13688.1 hypothetical protein [Candidatus Woesearchaeota archaeon]